MMGDGFMSDFKLLHFLQFFSLCDFSIFSIFLQRIPITFIIIKLLKVVEEIHVFH